MSVLRENQPRPSRGWRRWARAAWRHLLPLRPLDPQGDGPRRWLRLSRRSAGIALWTLISVPVQSVLLVVPGRARVAFARLYWLTFCRLIGLEVRVIGQPSHPEGRGRRVVFVSNHSSWLDIPVLGGQLEACFIAKAEVGAWPVIRTIARLGRTEFVSRRKSRIGPESRAIGERLAAGDDLILFPEGTTSDGARVLPFRSSFFALAETKEPPILQPISIVYDRLDGLPALRTTRPLFAWYGDMEIGPHFWRLARHYGLRASIILHTPLDPSGCADRKLLARDLWQVVADGAATLRQNRPARPLATSVQAVRAHPAETSSPVAPADGLEGSALAALTARAAPVRPRPEVGLST